jgi:hypothetical protein
MIYIDLAGFSVVAKMRLSNLHSTFVVRFFDGKALSFLMDRLTHYAENADSAFCRRVC